MIKCSIPLYHTQNPKSKCYSKMLLVMNAEVVGMTRLPPNSTVVNYQQIHTTVDITKLFQIQFKIVYHQN